LRALYPDKRNYPYQIHRKGKYTMNPYYTNTPGVIVYHRPPTAAEIKFGYGATHYAEIPENVARKADGTIKKWCVGPYDGLRYYR
jgi:hypothetical protein